MGVKMNRKKEQNLKLSLLYRITKMIPINSNKKLKIFLDLAWIFNRLAHEETFKSSYKISTKKEDEFLLRYIEKDYRIIDIGCGNGDVIDKIIKKATAKNIIGIDYNQASINRIKEKYGDTIKLVCDDLFNYLGNNKEISFDVVILSHILEHLENPSDFLNKISKTSKYFYIEVPDFQTNHLNLYREKINTDLIYTDIDHVTEFDRNELETIISNANLKIIERDYIFGVMKYWCESII
jgi:SAM-dependent methyltransferase